MKIFLLFPSDLYYGEDPAQKRTFHIARALSQRGHELIVAHFPKDAPNGILEREDPHHHWRVFSLSRQPEKLSSQIRWSIGQAEGCDVIHISKCHPRGALGALRAARSKGIPACCDWESWEARRLKASGASGAFALAMACTEYLTLQMATVVAAPNHELYQLAIKVGVPRSRAYIVPDTERDLWGTTAGCFERVYQEALSHSGIGV